MTWLMDHTVLLQAGKLVYDPELISPVPASSLSWKKVSFPFHVDNWHACHHPNPNPLLVTRDELRLNLRRRLGYELMIV